MVVLHNQYALLIVALRRVIRSGGGCWQRADGLCDGSMLTLCLDLTVFVLQADRYGDVECRAMSRLALHRHFSSDRIDDLLHESQSEAGADMLRFRLCLVEGFEDTGEGLLVHTFARVRHICVQRPGALPYLHTDFSVFGCELQCVRQEVAHHLFNIVRHEVRHGLLVSDESQFDVPAAGIVAVCIDNHGYECSDVSASPVGVSHRRLYFCYVEQLVDEGEQAVALPVYGVRLLRHVRGFLPAVLQFLTQSEDDSERRAELVRDVSVERLAHRAELLQRLVAACLHALRVDCHKE